MYTFWKRTRRAIAVTFDAPDERRVWSPRPDEHAAAALC